MADEFASLRHASLISEAALRVDVAARIVATSSREAADDETLLQDAWAAFAHAEETVTQLQQQLRDAERACGERANGLQRTANNSTSDDAKASASAVAALRFRLTAAMRDVAQKGDALQQLQRDVEVRQQQRLREAHRQALLEQQQQEEQQQQQQQQQQQASVVEAKTEHVDDDDEEATTTTGARRGSGPVPVQRGVPVRPLSARTHGRSASSASTSQQPATVAAAASSTPTTTATRQRPLPGMTLETYSGGTVLPSLNRVLVSRAEIRARHLRYEDDNDPAAFAARVRKRRKLERVNALLQQEQQQQQSSLSSSQRDDRTTTQQSPHNNNNNASVSSSSSLSSSSSTVLAAAATTTTATVVKNEAACDDATAASQPPTAIDVDLLMEEEEAIGDGIVRQLLQQRRSRAATTTATTTTKTAAAHKVEDDKPVTTPAMAVKVEVKQEAAAAAAAAPLRATRLDANNNNNSNSSSDSDAASSATQPSRHSNSTSMTATATVAAPVDVTVVPGIRIAAAVHARLFDYQQEGLRWLLQLHQHRCGGILGDEMGLGKTIQVAAMINALAHSHQLAGPVLIVAPMTVLRQWVAELHRWAPYVRTCVMHVSSSSSNNTSRPATAPMTREALLQSVQGTPAVVITTYAALRTHGALLHTAGFQYVILDEGHKIANPDAGITLVAKSFATPHRLLLSGSPIQNSLKELWCLFDFVRPGLLGSLAHFVDAFELPIGQSKNPRATPLALATAVECARALQRQIAPYLLRRLKAVVNATLPRRFERVVRVLLTDEQLRLYVDVVASPAVQRLFSQALYFPKLGHRLDAEGRDASGSLHVAGASYRHATARRGGGGGAGGGGATTRGLHLEAFRVMNQLRQICNHADLYTVLRGLHEEEEEQQQQLLLSSQPHMSSLSRLSSVGGRRSGLPRRGGRHLLASSAPRSFRSNHPVNLAGSAKLQVLQQMLREWHTHHHRVLVFSQTRMMLDILENLCEQDNYRYIRLDGTTSNRHRQELIDRYNEDADVFVALLTTRVGGIGVNLVGADRVVIFDPDWNPVTDVQARERAWRIGQTREVCVYRLITSGTVEEAILRRQLAKTYVTEKVLRDPTLQRFFHVHDSFVEHFFLGLDYDARIPAGQKHVLSPYDMRGPRRAHTRSDHNNNSNNNNDQHDNNDNNNSNNSNNDDDEALLLSGDMASARPRAHDANTDERTFGEAIAVDKDADEATRRATTTTTRAGDAGSGSDDAETRLLRELVDGQEVVVSGSDAVAQRLARVGAAQAMQRVTAHAASRTLAQQYSEYSLLRAAEEQRRRADADRDEQRRYAAEDDAAAQQQQQRRARHR